MSGHIYIYMYVRGIELASISTNFWLDLGIILTDIDISTDGLGYWQLSVWCPTHYDVTDKQQ